MGSAFHQLCPKYSGTLTPIAPTAIRLWETFPFLLSLLTRHLVIGQRQKIPNFSAFHWSPHGCLITIGQHFVTTRVHVVHLPKRTETSLITESDQSRANQQLLQLCTVRTAWSDSDQAVRAVHSCKNWFEITITTVHIIQKAHGARSGL